jgi:hypothetical protein
MTDLIKRLRAKKQKGNRFDSLEYEAADRIEELVKERDDLGRKLNTARYGQPDFAWSIHEKEMADLRAKLAIAVESIKQSIKLWEKYDDTELKWDRDYKLDNAYDGFELLFKALAELEGK